MRQEDHAELDAAEEDEKDRRRRAAVDDGGQQARQQQDQHEMVQEGAVPVRAGAGGQVAVGGVHRGGLPGESKR
ncbi:hypothetical protein GCM10023082_04100 [Streptomyces tremellae]|uniref:Uncharacterized protein n=1 Tax=Streptomyces tremellae TaxID=1124239 RepID=A0ABP7DRQ0_9ACTN